MAGYGTGYGAGGRGGGGGDSVAPAVYDFSPASGTPITPATAIAFKVADETALRRVVIHVYYDAIGTNEVVYGGTGFTREFETYSTMEPATFGSLVGYAVSLRRYHGWPSPPRFEVIATDRGGNEASG